MESNSINNMSSIIPGIIISMSIILLIIIIYNIIKYKKERLAAPGVFNRNDTEASDIKGFFQDDIYHLRYLYNRATNF